MKLTKGTILKARGGWDAEVVWIALNSRGGFYAVHCPEPRDGFNVEDDESVPIWHWADGTAHSTISINEPPTYNGHPADLEMGEYEL